jgi:hypothetical protein
MYELIRIQDELKAPKNQYNAFGKYKYRNCEDILEALKPLLFKYECCLTITDEIKEASGFLYVESTVILHDCKEETITVRACAGIDPTRKGMDIAQSFGASSSYARKYALNGLFLIDDTKDPDTIEEPKNPTLKIVNDELMNKLTERFSNGETDVFEKAKAHFTFRQQDLVTIKKLMDVLSNKK